MDRGFIRTDYEMLSKHYDVTDFHFKGILSIPKLLWKMRKHNLIFVWFISLHTFFTAFSKKPKIYVAGGYDVANEPNIRYGLARGGILKRMVRHCLDHADRILTVSKANNEDLKNNFGDGYPVSMVYNCPDANLFKPSDEEKDKNLILTVGLVSRETWIRKGIAKFVDVAHFCNEMKAPYKFVVVGKIEPDMMKTVKDAQRTTENLTFTGFVPDKDLLAYYQRAKVYCQFSYYESYGLTVSESMLCECVPVVSDRKALPEVIGDYGFKVDIYDMNAIYNVIGKAVERSGKEGREFTLQNFSMTKRENALVGIIDGLLDAKPKKLAEEKKELHQSIGILKERFQDRQLTGVEIGVFKGEHAKELLSQLNIKKLYLVDPYEYRGLFGRKMDFWDAYGQARKNLQGFEKYEFILSKSKDAIASIPEKVDFVYIDGNHRFSSVLRDILDYNDILKSSGLLMGHDYRSKRNPDTSAAIILGSLLLDKKLKHDGMEWWFE